MITIRRATREDIPLIMKFLNEHWLEGYALARDRALFDWQFVENETVHIFLGIDDEEHRIYAMEGAILYNREPHPDLVPCLWIALKCDVPMLGWRLSERLLKEYDIRAGYAVGLTEEAVGIQRRLHKEVYAMDHYVRLNDLLEYRIARIVTKEIPEVSDTGYRLGRIRTAQEMREAVSPGMLTACSPHKDYKYVEWRYLKHPVFHYDLWKITDPADRPAGMLVTREEHANESTSAKLVDFYGENETLSRIGTAVDVLLREKGYEFLDVYSYGVDPNLYEAAGFVRVDETSGNIVPNLFQPYLCKNTSIYVIKPLVDDARFFRGDADQDKPRLATYL